MGRGLKVMWILIIYCKDWLYRFFCGLQRRKEAWITRDRVGQVDRLSRLPGVIVTRIRGGAGEGG